MPSKLSKIYEKKFKEFKQAQKTDSSIDYHTGEESDTHGLVRELYQGIKATYKQNQNSLEPKVERAAKSFLKELKDALDFDMSNTRPVHPIFPNDSLFQHQLVEKTINIIEKYKTQLGAAPGFWNQITAHINTFIEKISGEKNYFNTEKTKFTEGVNLYKEGLVRAKKI